jgi:hypothetical protein
MARDDSAGRESISEEAKRAHRRRPRCYDRRMRLASMLAFALGFAPALLASCTSSSEVRPDAPSDRCEGYGPNDSCMNEDNFRECQRAAAECPGAVLVLESCPLQFRCPS